MWCQPRVRGADVDVAAAVSVAVAVDVDASVSSAATVSVAVVVSDASVCALQCAYVGAMRLVTYRHVYVVAACFVRFAARVVDVGLSCCCCCCDVFVCRMSSAPCWNRHAVP